jgi:excisionase family DNA binding protein
MTKNIEHVVSPDRVPVTPIAVSPLEAAQMLGVSRDFVYQLIRDRLIESAKAGSRVLVDVESLRDYYESIRRSA